VTHRWRPRLRETGHCWPPYTWLRDVRVAYPHRMSIIGETLHWLARCFLGRSSPRTVGFQPAGKPMEHRPAGNWTSNEDPDPIFQGGESAFQSALAGMDPAECPDPRRLPANLPAGDRSLRPSPWSPTSAGRTLTASAPNRCRQSNTLDAILDTDDHIMRRPSEYCARTPDVSHHPAKIEGHEHSSALTTLECAALWIGMKDAFVGHVLSDERAGRLLHLVRLIYELVAGLRDLSLANPRLEALRRIGLRTGRDMRAAGSEICWSELVERARTELAILSLKPCSPNQERSGQGLPNLVLPASEDTLPTHLPAICSLGRRNDH
jgi:hypothetical protein